MSKKFVRKQEQVILFEDPNRRKKKKVKSNSAVSSVKRFVDKNKSLFNKLSSKQRAFFLEYIKDYNGLAAAKRAGYKEHSAHSIAWQTLRNHNVIQALEEWEKDIATRFIDSKEKITKEMSLLAFSDIGDFLDENGDLRVRNLRELPPQATRCIKKVTYRKKTVRLAKDTNEGKAGDEVIDENCYFELYDKKAALEALGKEFNMFKDKRELTGADGTPLIPAATTVILDFGGEQK
jgi:hypothetical protein